MRNLIAAIGVWAIGMLGKLIYFFVIALPIMFLWNGLEIFPTIHYGQAFVIVVMASLLTEPPPSLEKKKE